MWSSNSTSGYTPQKIESRDSNTYLHTNVHSSIIHKNQKVETTQISIDERLDK